MYPKPSEFLERHRITRGSLGTTAARGNNGAFLVPGPSIHKLQLIASDQEFWEHVSVSVPRQSRTPTWAEMCYVKDLFWDEEETVIQYHPPKSEYVTVHDYCLHLWRPIAVMLPRPPYTMVGPKGADEGLELPAGMFTPAHRGRP